MAHGTRIDYLYNLFCICHSMLVPLFHPSVNRQLAVIHLPSQGRKNGTTRQSLVEFID